MSTCFYMYNIPYLHLPCGTFSAFAPRDLIFRPFFLRPIKTHFSAIQNHFSGALFL